MVEATDFERMMEGGETEITSRLQGIEQQEWILWATAGTITLLLTIGIVSFVFPLLRTAETSDRFFGLQNELIGLAGVVLLFDLYSIHQQLQLHRIRRQLIQNQQLFRLISEHAADMIAVVDTEGKRLYNSKSYEKVLGYTASDLQKSSSFEQIHPDDRERVRQASIEAKRSGIGKTMVYRMRHKDGSWRVLESTANVIQSPDGDIQKLVIVNRDITERKRVDEALTKSEASFRSVVEDAPYGIYRFDQEGHFLRANPALQRILGYSSIDELLTVSLKNDVYRHPEDFERLCESLRSSDDFKDLEMEWQKKNGAPITVRCHGRRVKDENDGPVYHEVFTEDVTEKRILEDKLHMAGKMEAVGRLSGGIAHDFNNLLSVMIGYSQMLKRKLRASPELSECAEEIEKAGRRASSLTRQLLAFSRQQILKPTVIDLNSLVSDMEKILPRLIREDISIRMDLQSSLGSVKADRGQIEQVIINLAVNARDAMPTGGLLVIQTANAEFDDSYVVKHEGAKAGHYVELAVSDSGIGMDQETIAHIFEPFFTTKGLGQGTGLGLATVYGIVKQSNGYIWVESSLGKGTCFRVFLPRVEEPVTPPSTTPAIDSAAKKGSETILLAEDSESLRKLVSSLLDGHGFKVLAAQNGEEALDVSEKYSGTIHLLLTDVVMPGINGRALAERLRLKRPETKILYMSGYTDSILSTQGVLDRSTNLLYKPFTEEQLINRVRNALKTAVTDERAEQTLDRQ
ncbi:MAG: PAS domain S-box protein [Candidatus Acidiferrum sp.]